MKIFQDLYINLHGYDINQLVNLLTAQTKHTNWTREQEQEQRANKFGIHAYCFSFKSFDKIPNAGLTLTLKEKDTWYVPNIVPTKSGQLKFDEYNLILQDFNKNILSPVISNIANIEINLTSDHINLNDVLGSVASSKLAKFSILANKSTGSSHPLDRDRWFDFLLELSKLNVNFDSRLLKEFLREQGWGDEEIVQLVIELEFALELLQYANK